MARRRLLRFYFYATYNSVSYDETFTVSSFDATGGTATVTINSSNPWTIEHCPTWLTVTPFYGTKGETNLTLTASENTGQSDLTDTIVFKTNNNQKTITANCTLKGADAPVVSYEVIVNVNNTNLTYSGSTTFNVKLNKTVDGVTTTTDITSTATLTTGGSITVNQNDAIVSGNNSTNYATTGTIKASYTPEGETSTVESSVVTINVAAKPMYSLTVTATPSTIASDGSSTLSAVYNTIIEGQTASTQPVTATYEITSGGDYATINGSVLDGNNSTSSSQSVVVKGTYNSVTGSTTVTVQAQATVYDFRVTFSTDPEDSDFEREIHVGDYVQAYAYRKTNNGNWVDVTNSVNWESNNSLVASVGDTAYVDKGKIYGKAVNENNVTITAYDTTSGKDDWVHVKVVPVQVYDISVSPTTKNIDYQQQSFNVTVSSTGQSWTVDTLPSFVSSVSPTSGSEGSTTVTVTCSQNTSSSNRSATLTFNGNESGSASVNIEQSGYNPTPTYRYELKILDSNKQILSYENVVENETLNAYAWLYTYADNSFISSGDVTNECEWKSYDENIATVDNTGEVTGNSVGDTTIEATYKIDDQNSIYENFTINVSSSVHTFTIEPSETAFTYNNIGESLLFDCKYDNIYVNPSRIEWDVDSSISEYITFNGSIGQLTLNSVPEGSSDATGTITASYNGLSAECTITIEHHEHSVYLTAITVSIETVPDIPAAGGSVDWSTATYTVTAHYSDSSTRDVTNESIKTSNTVTASTKGTVVSEPNIAGQLTISADYLTLTDDGTIDVYQEENKVEDNGILSETTPEETTTTYVCGTTVYNITVEPSSANVDSEAGYLSGVTVTGTKTTPYSATTTTSWDVKSTPWSAYTSTASGYGETTITHDSSSTQTSDELSETATTELDEIDVAVITAATTSEIYYGQNNSTSSRNGWARYRVVESPSVTTTFTLTQEGKDEPTPSGRTVTFNTTANSFVNNGNMTIRSMACYCTYNDEQVWWAEYVDTDDGLTQGEETTYPNGRDWSIDEAFYKEDKFTIWIEYGVSVVVLSVTFTMIEGEAGASGADKTESFSVYITDSDIEVDVTLPSVEWKNE